MALDQGSVAIIMLESDSNLFGTSSSRYSTRAKTTVGLKFAAANLEDWHSLMCFPISTSSMHWDNGHKLASLFAWLACSFLSSDLLSDLLF
jgi:hypothetical protein